MPLSAISIYRIDWEGKINRSKEHFNRSKKVTLSDIVIKYTDKWSVLCVVLVKYISETII